MSLPPPLPLSPAPPPNPPVSKLRWAIHLAIIASLPIIVATMGASAKGNGPALTHTVHGLLTVCAFELLFFSIFFAAAWIFSRASKDDLLLHWRPGYWVVPLGAIYSVGIRFAAGLAALFVAMIVAASMRASPIQVQDFVNEHRPQIENLVDLKAISENPAYFWLNVIVVSFVLGGLREEIWRSSFLAGLRSLWPRIFGSPNGGILAAGVAALFFGVGHLPQGWVAASVITVVGFLLGVIMTVHRSVWPSVVAHGCFDAVSMSLLPWAMRYLQEIQRLQHSAG